MPVAVSSLCVLPAGGDKVNASPAGCGVAVFQLRQLLCALGCRLDAEAGLARPGRRLAAQPVRFAAHLVGNLPRRASLRLEKILTPAGKRIVRAGSAEETTGIDAIDLDYLVGHCPEKGAIVRGDQVAESSLTQQPLQPDNARQVEMIGRFVEQQQVGPADKFTGQSQPLAPPERVSTHWSGSARPTCVSVMPVRVSRRAP